MKPGLSPPLAALALFASLTFPGVRPEASAQDVKEQSIAAPRGVTIKVRMEGPNTADTPRTHPSRSSATSNIRRTGRGG